MSLGIAIAKSKAIGSGIGIAGKGGVAVGAGTATSSATAVANGRKKRGVIVGEVEGFVSLVQEVDDKGCARKLKCELRTRKGGKLSKEELELLMLIGDGVRSGEGLLPNSALWGYGVARGLGKAGWVCKEVYPACPLADTATAYLL